MLNDEIHQGAKRYLFRSIHPLISIGTASHRYRGWTGQIYSEELYREQITSRANRVGNKSFREEVLPVNSVWEYFQHFKVLEIDYTFYAPLIANGVPTHCANTLKQYSMRMGPEDRVFLKAPQMFFVRKLRRGKPLRSERKLPRLGCFLPGNSTNQRSVCSARSLKAKFSSRNIRDSRSASHPWNSQPSSTAFSARFLVTTGTRWELRTEAYYCKPVIDVLRKHGAGQILSHWTWLPALKRQFSRAGDRFITAGGRPSFV